MYYQGDEHSSSEASTTTNPSSSTSSAYPGQRPPPPRFLPQRNRPHPRPPPPKTPPFGPSNPAQPPRSSPLSQLPAPPPPKRSPKSEPQPQSHNQDVSSTAATAAHEDTPLVSSSASTSGSRSCVGGIIGRDRRISRLLKMIYHYVQQPSTIRVVLGLMAAAMVLAVLVCVFGVLWTPTSSALKEGNGTWAYPGGVDEFIIGGLDTNCPIGPACKLPTREATSEVHIGQLMIGTTNENFICVTMDWWPPEKCDYGHCPWHNASMLSADLNLPLLRDAVSNLSPVVLRLGGSLTDKIVYKVPSVSGQPPPSCQPITKDENDPLGFQGGCLTMKRWDELNKFCADLGCSVVFDLNLAGGFATKPSDPYWRGGTWDYSNVRAFLEYTRAAEYPILGFELGNEVDIFHGVGARVPDREMVSGFVKLHEMITELWGKHNPSRPLVIGPDSSVFDMEWYLEFAIRMGKNLYMIDVFTYHIYSLGPGSPLLNPNMTDHMLNATKLDTLHVTTDNAQRFVHTLREGGRKNFQLWCGEAGGAYNSGRNLYTNSFISGFWFLDQLGTMASQSHQTYCRQTLIGGYYGLLNITTMNVNPDYYTAVLWRRLMGRKVLQATVNNTHYQGQSVKDTPYYVGENIRIYAHCTHRWFLEKHANKKRGSLTLAFINLSTHVKHTLNLDGAVKSSVRAEYIMQSPRKKDEHLGLYAHHVQLNGKTLRVLNNKIPDLPPNWVFDRSKPLVIPPLSYGYIVFPDAKNQACLTPPIPLNGRPLKQ